MLTAATATAKALVNLDHHDAQADVDAVLATATGTFAEQYEASSTDVVKLAREAHSVMTGTVKAAGIATIGADSARVIVATSGEVTNDSTGGSPRENNYRMQLDLVRVGDDWLTADLQFVS